MSILVDENTKVVIQGITGSIGRYISNRMITQKDTNLLAGVTPGKGGQQISGVPVFDSVYEAVEATGANTSLVYVPAKGTASAITEAADAGIRLCVIYTEGVPVHETGRAIEYARLKGMRVVGPNAAGIASPGKGNVSEFDNRWLSPGSIGITSKSGTLTYDVLKFSSEFRGVSTIACLGGDQFAGTRLDDALPLFEEDPQTELVILLGEIGGTDEMAAAEVVRKMKKPVVSYICGMCAPKEKPMGHAGAIQSRHSDSAEVKSRILGENGAHVAKTREEIFVIVKHLLEGKK